MNKSSVNPEHFNWAKSFTASEFQPRLLQSLVTLDQSTGGGHALSIKSSHADYSFVVEQDGGRSCRGHRSKLDMHLISRFGIYFRHDAILGMKTHQKCKVGQYSHRLLAAILYTYAHKHTKWRTHEWSLDFCYNPRSGPIFFPVICNNI
jgi:hypothetical protein